MRFDASEGESHREVVAEDHAGARLDRWLAEVLPGVSRSLVRRVIDMDLVRVDGQARPFGDFVTFDGERSIARPVAHGIGAAEGVEHRQEHGELPQGRTTQPGSPDHRA